jgi:hypothetical protein
MRRVYEHYLLFRVVLGAKASSMVMIMMLMFTGRCIEVKLETYLNDLQQVVIVLYNKNKICQLCNGYELII